ncbi:hypothetical protein MTO96_011859 [Rhipicephalus appendiculatus]
MCGRLSPGAVLLRRDVFRVGVPVVEGATEWAHGPLPRRNRRDAASWAGERHGRLPAPPPRTHPSRVWGSRRPGTPLLLATAVTMATRAARNLALESSRAAGPELCQEVSE